MRPRSARLALASFLLTSIVLAGCQEKIPVDLVLRGGTIYDGSGSAPVVGDVAVVGDSVVAAGDVGARTGASGIDVTGMAVAPGFVKMLSWATESLIEDGRGLSDIAQGVTLEVFGEGASRFVYRPRRPTTTPLYGAVQHHLETFLAAAEDEDPADWGVPSWVERDAFGTGRCEPGEGTSE